MKATGTLFSNLLQGQQHFVVPLFQRPYTWEDAAWQALFDDVLEVYQEEGHEERHFVGSIVTKSLGATPEGVSPFLIIDGQQRLTTVTLLLAALRDLTVEVAPKLSEKIHKLYLTNEFASGNHRYKVLPTQTDRASYQAIVDGTPPAIEAPDKNSPLQYRAYGYFLERLREERVDGEPLDPIKLEQVLVGSLEVVSITLEDADNEYRIFESLNGTGTPLAQADLIRNYFFMRAPIDEHEDLYHNVWLPTQKSLGGALDIFFRHAYMSDGQFVRQSDVYRAWKDRLDPVSADQLGERMKDLAAEAENYRKLLAPAEEPDAGVSRGLSRLNRWGGQTSYPFLLNVYRLYGSGAIDAGMFAEVLGIMESFLVRRLFARVPPGQLNRLFLRLYHQLPQGMDLAQGTRAVLSEPSRRWPRDDDFRKAVLGLPLYTDGRPEQRRLVLESLEENYGTKEPVDLSTLTIEHVMPQTPNEEWLASLGESSEDLYLKTVHTIGNLTLTGYNSELSNSPFRTKRVKLAESNVSMNKEIAQEKVWGFAQIEERGERLAERAISIWPGPASTGAAVGATPIPTSSSQGTGTTWVGKSQAHETSHDLMPEGRETATSSDLPPPEHRKDAAPPDRATLDRSASDRSASVACSEEVEQNLRVILPDADMRQRCLTLFADAIDEANLHGRDIWAVTDGTRGVRKVRLVVGHVVVCILSNGRIWMALDDEMLGASGNGLQLQRSDEWEWATGRFAEYRQIPSRNGYYRPAEMDSDTWSVVRQLHFESIRKAADLTTMDPRTPRKHSAETLQCLRDELGRRVPDPRY